MQRLFSTFANGWPGVGLLLLRVLTATVLIRFGVAGLLQKLPLSAVVPQVIGIVAGTLRLIGLWTPLAGTLTALVDAWIALCRYSPHAGDPWVPIMTVVLGAALAMIGPGAWSVDARLFGRKHIDFGP